MRVYFFTRRGLLFHFFFSNHLRIHSSLFPSVGPVFVFPLAHDDGMMIWYSRVRWQILQHSYCARRDAYMHSIPLAVVGVNGQPLILI